MLYRHNKKEQVNSCSYIQEDAKCRQKEIECPHPTLRLVMNTRYGAGGRTRTGTLSPAVDFESTTSTNSITPAGCDFFRTDIICLNRLKCKHFFIELALSPQNTVTEAKIHDTCRSRSRRRRCMIRFSSREIYDCEMPSRSATSFCVFSFCPLKPKRRETI